MICLQFFLICIISWIGFLLSSEPNYYKILGVSKTSGVDEIKKQYRKLAKKYHPDKNKNDPNAETKFISITKAYEILSDSQQRAIYDQEQSFSSGRFGSHQDPMRRWQGQGQGQYPPDVDDIVRGFQNFGFQQNNGERRRRNQQPQQEYEQEYETYAFMGPDGRIYYQQRPIRRQKRYTYQSTQSIDLTDILLSLVVWPIFNLLLLIFACTTFCRLCFSSSSEKESDKPFPPPKKNTTNNTTNNTNNNTSGNTNSNRVLMLPKLSIQHIQETGVIVIVGMNTYTIQLLFHAREHFQYDDKLLFCQFPYQHLMNMSQKDEAMEASDKKLLTYFQSIQSSFPSTMTNCLIALTKEGKKYNICSKALVPHSLSSSDLMEDENYVLEWILQVLEGRRTWQTKS